MLEWDDPDRRDAALERLLVRVNTPERERVELTLIEREALQAAAEGLDWRQTAELYGTSPDAVRESLKRARRVLAAKNTTHAVALALRRGLIR